METSWLVEVPCQPSGGERRHLKSGSVNTFLNKVAEYIQQDVVILLVTIVPLSVRGSKAPILLTYPILWIIFP